MHSLLKRQIRKKLGNREDSKDIDDFLAAVDDAYHQADQDRQLLERSLHLTSQELNEKNQQQRQQIQELHETHRQLGQSLAVLSATFDATGEAILAFDVAGNLINSNEMSAVELKVGEKDSRRKGLFQYLYYFRHQVKDFSELIYQLRQLKTNQYKKLFGTVEFKNNQIYEYRSLPQIADGQLLGRVWCVNNVTVKKRNEEKIIYQSQHDALTGLPNRTSLLSRLKQAIAYSDRENYNTVVAFVDLDYFKKINDTCGHQKGDMLLVEAAQRIQGELRKHDMVARVGGDEFIILMEKVEEPSVATRVCQRILDQLKKPFALEGNHFYISASIGLSIFPLDDKIPEELIRKADIAMYHAKDKGRGIFQYFDNALEQLTLHQLQVENDLRTAILNDELELYYQPRVSSKNYEFNSLEALVRWSPKDGGQIFPDEFIPIAENTGLIIELGEWVFREACRQIAEWKEQGQRKLSVSINLSAKELLDDQLAHRMTHLMNEYGVSGSQLEIEITEGVLLEDIEIVQKTLQELHQLGIKISIDDFGTGYSSMRYLQQLPIDILKIDKSFVLNLDENAQNDAIVSAVIALAHGLHLKVVAEGVETSLIANKLKEKGCDFQQGYYHQRPAPADSILNTSPRLVS